MSDMNRVILIGRLTKDPELRYTQGGTSVASFTIANNKTYSTGEGKKESVSFFNCIAWGKLGETICEYVKKGHPIALEGRLQQRSWEDSNGNKRQTVEVVLENFQFLSSRNSNSNSQSSGGHQNGKHQPSPSHDDIPDNPFSDDDILF